MPKKPDIKKFTDNAGAPAYDVNSPSRDKIGLYAGDFHDISEIIVPETEPNFDRLTMTKASAFPESAFGRSLILSGDELFDFDGVVPGWDTNPGTSEIAKWTTGGDTIAVINTKRQFEGAGCLSLSGVSNTPNATRAWAGLDWSRKHSVWISLNSNKPGIKKVRFGTDASNYLEWDLNIPTKNEWKQFELQLNGSGFGQLEVSETGINDESDMGYMYVAGTTGGAPETILVDMVTLRNGFDAYPTVLGYNTPNQSSQENVPPYYIAPLILVTNNTTPTIYPAATSSDPGGKGTGIDSTMWMDRINLTQRGYTQVRCCATIATLSVASPAVFKFMVDSVSKATFQNSTTSWVSYDTGWVTLTGITDQLNTVEVTMRSNHTTTLAAIRALSLFLR